MAAWWVAPQVTDPTVEGEQHPALVRGCGHDHLVALAGEVFLDHGVHVKDVPTELRSQSVRQVLVELELHAGNGWISSRASAAPYAAAARTRAWPWTTTGSVTMSST